MLNNKISSAVAGFAVAVSPLLPGCAEKPASPSPSDNKTAAVSVDNGLTSIELPKIDRTQAKGQLSAAEHIEGYMQEAKKLMKVIDPKLLNELNRDGLTIEVVPNLTLSIREITDKLYKETGMQSFTVGNQPEDGICLTPLRPRTREELEAQYTKIAEKATGPGMTGDVVMRRTPFGAALYRDGKLIGSVNTNDFVAMDSHILLKQSIYDPKKSEVDNLAYGIAVFVHETYHLADYRINPPKGYTISSSSGMYLIQGEISAYTQEIAFLEKAAEIAKKGGDKQLANAFKKVIKKEQKYLNSYKEK